MLRNGLGRLTSAILHATAVSELHAVVVHTAPPIRAVGVPSLRQKLSPETVTLRAPVATPL